MTLIFGIAAGLVAYVLILAFWPVILLGAMGLLFMVVSVSPELGNAGRALALLGMFGAFWLAWKIGRDHIGQAIGK